MPNYTVTIDGGVFDIDADDEDAARDAAIDQLVIEVEKTDDDEADEDDDEG